MTTVQAYAATEVDGEFQPFEYELGALGPNDVDIEVLSCGICHSDLSMLENAWGMTSFPFVPGHEVIGKISSVGELVNHLSIGDVVGVGWHTGYCMVCDECIGGHHNLCAQAEPAIVNKHGGFASMIRAKAASVTKLPQTLDASKAGPLFCGGMAVFGPMEQLNLAATSTVGVIGIGGLGHLALKFARAWGCRVIAFTSSDAKRQEALSLGAHEVVNSRDPDAIKGVARQIDLLLSTVNVNLDWNAYIATLKPRGRLHMLGAVTEPLGIDIIPMMFNDLSVGASPVGSPATIRKMLAFSALHNILPVTEHFPMSQVNDAMEHLRSGRAKYRIVLDN